MSNIKDKVVDTWHAVVDAATNVGHKIAEGASEAAASVKENAVGRREGGRHRRGWRCRGLRAVLGTRFVPATRLCPRAGRLG